jgi:DNA replication protein DnaC
MDANHPYDVSTPEGLRERTEDIARRRIPPRYREAAATDAGVIAWADSLIAACQDGSLQPVRPLLITGPTGVGKTHEAYGALRRIAAAGVVIGWLSVNEPDMYARLRPRDGADTEAEYEQFASVPLLMLDDLGAAKPSEWTEETLYRLIDHRSAALLPSVVTTNLPVRSRAAGQRSLESAMSGRVFSRLAEFATVSLKGNDRRLGPA